MARESKNRKAVTAKYDADKIYTLDEAAKVLKDITFTKFDSSVDVDIRLGIDPKKSDQMVRGVVSLPHGLGKVVRVLVLCSPDKAQEAKDAGAEHVGLDEYIQKIGASSGYFALSFTLEDTYGNSGLICVVLLEKQDEILFIDTWIFN